MSNGLDIPGDKQVVPCARREMGPVYPLSYEGFSSPLSGSGRNAGVSNCRIHDLRKTAGSRLYRVTGDIVCRSDFPRSLEHHHHAQALHARGAVGRRSPGRGLRGVLRGRTWQGRRNQPCCLNSCLAKEQRSTYGRPVQRRFLTVEQLALGYFGSGTLNLSQTSIAPKCNRCSFSVNPNPMQIDPTPGIALASTEPMDWEVL